MKKSSGIVKLTVIVACGLVLALVILKLTMNNTENVLVAVDDIPAGTQLTESMFQVKRLHNDGIEPDSIKATSEMTDKDGSLKAISVTKILKGSQLSATNIALPNSDNSIAARIEKGNAGILLPINQVNGLSNSLNINDTIDLLATVDQTVDDASGRRDEPQTIVLGENIRIIGIEKDTDGKVIGYIIDVKGQIAIDISHILSTQDKDNQSAIRVIVTGIGANKSTLPKTPVGDIVSRYLNK